MCLPSPTHRATESAMFNLIRSAWYATDAKRVIFWSLVVGFVVYVVASFGEFVAGVARAVTP